MASLFQRLDEEEAIVRAELDALRERLVVAEERLARLVITRETALRLLGDLEPVAGATPTRVSAAAAALRPAGDPGLPSVRELDESRLKLAVVESRFACNAARPRPFVPPSRAERTSAPPPASGLLECSEGQERILELLATSGRVMRAREIAAALGEDVSLRARIETTRGRCKRLVKEGKAVEVEPGCFQIAPRAARIALVGEEMFGMG